MGVFETYRQAVEMKHGWDIPLACPQCGHEAPPAVDGWTPNKAIRFGDRATIFANVTCASCGADLRATAGAVLAETFRDVETDPRATRALYGFLGVLLGVPLVLAGVVWAGAAAGWWGYTGFVALSIMPLLLWPTMMWFNYRVHAIRQTCPCGAPEYIFMGLLGRSYCHRCRTCGRLLRLRD